MAWMVAGLAGLALVCSCARCQCGESPDAGNSEAAEQGSVVSGNTDREGGGRSSESGGGATSFTFSEFDAESPLAIHGATSFEEGRLQLTPSNRGKAAAVWYDGEAGPQVLVGEGFETTFTFRMSDGKPFRNESGGDGIAFVLHQSPKGIEQGPSRHAGLGVGSLGYGEIPHSIAVEIDNSENPDDPNGNHIGLHSAGPDETSEGGGARLATRKISSPKDFIDGEPHTLRIRYAPEASELVVALDDREVVSTSIDLVDKLELSKGRAYVGFTGSTLGRGAARQDILDWEFRSSTEPE